jgi:putative DNA primase/helicase
LGDREYSNQVNIDSLMMDPRGTGSNNAVNADLADLQGARFVFTSEVDKAQRLSLGRVKYLTGLTAIKTRRLRENWITFPPTHKIFMDCNDRPVISSPNDAVWNRLICVPFDVVIPDSEIDRDLISKLESELPGILRWIVEGALKYSRDGLRGRPIEVQVSTEEYRQSSDRLKEFIEDCCHLNQHAWVSSERLVNTYQEWCKRNGEKYPLEGRDFTDQLRAKGCSPKTREVRRRSIRGWNGIDLKESAKPESEGEDEHE